MLIAFAFFFIVAILFARFFDFDLRYLAAADGIYYPWALCGRGGVGGGRQAFPFGCGCLAVPLNARCDFV